VEAIVTAVGVVFSTYLTKSDSLVSIVFIRLHGRSVLAREIEPYQIYWHNVSLVQQPPAMLGLGVIVALVCPLVTVEKINGVDTMLEYMEHYLPLWEVQVK
jgi:hypothetical protein